MNKSSFEPRIYSAVALMLHTENGSYPLAAFDSMESAKMAAEKFPQDPGFSDYMRGLNLHLLECRQARLQGKTNPITSFVEVDVYVHANPTFSAASSMIGIETFVGNPASKLLAEVISEKVRRMSEDIQLGHKVKIEVTAELLPNRTHSIMSHYIILDDAESPQAEGDRANRAKS